MGPVNLAKVLIQRKTNGPESCPMAARRFLDILVQTGVVEKVEVASGGPF